MFAMYNPLMQRRQLLKLILPIALLTTGVVGVAMGRKLIQKPGCVTLDPVLLHARLKRFSDVELGKKAALEVSAAELAQLQSLCEQDFDQRYRELVQDDFAKGHIERVDGWILTHTEALTHRLAYHSASL